MFGEGVKWGLERHFNMDIITKKYPIISIAITIVIALFVQSVIAGDASLITKAIVQFGWCGNGDAICLLKYYVYASLGILGIGIIIQIIYSWKKSWKAKTAEKICRLAEKFKDSFGYIKYEGIGKIIANEDELVSKGGKRLLIRLDFSEKYLREFIKLFEKVKFHFDGRKVVEDNLQELWKIFWMYSNTIQLYFIQMEVEPRAVSPIFISQIYGEDALKNIKAVDNIIESIMVIFEPYIRGEK